MNRWIQHEIRFRDGQSAEHAAAHRLAPALTAAKSDLSLDGWWYMRKNPFKLRYRAEVPVPSVTGLLDSLTAEGLITGWTNGIYEPETAAFGGERGMEVAQTLLSPLDRRDYLALHVEPSFSEKLTLNASALVELDALGALLRIGADYRFSIFSLHAYAGFTTGANDSELGRHLVRAFGEVVLAASL